MRYHQRSADSCKQNEEQMTKRINPGTEGPDYTGSSFFCKEEERNNGTE